MSEQVFDFLKKQDSLVLTTHDNPDPDGIGSELVFSKIAQSFGKKVRIINSNPTPKKYCFLDPESTIEIWDEAKSSLPADAALVFLDTSDEYNIGKVREFIPNAVDIFFIDHHERNEFCTFKGLIDSKASSTCEITVELALEAGLELMPILARAAFAGLVYDTNFFAYNKTSIRTFKVAVNLVESGVNPYQIYHEFFETSSIGALLLEKTVLSTMEIVNDGRVAVQTLRKEDLEKCQANIEDSENFINTPLKCKEIEVSVLIKQNREGNVRCSLRSKGKVNVSKIAQKFGGGGHVSAAGFRSKLGIEDTKDTVLKSVFNALGK